MVQQLARRGRIGILLLAIASGLTGCALTPQQQADIQNRQNRFLETRPKCRDERSCERLWAAARNWVINTCAMKIQTISESYIETYNSVGQGAGLACRVTKDPLPNEGYVLTVMTWCDNILACIPNGWDAAFNFNYAVQAAAPYEVQQ